jgi:enamine deaminase RidA (YjgF/YER057c/UK114 family)
MSASGSPQRSMVSAEQRLRDLGIQLPPAPTPFGAYVPAVQAGNLLFLSGMLPTHGHEPRVLGRLGKDVDVDSARNAARIAALNAVALARQHLGTLDRVRRVVRLGVAIATTGEHSGQVEIADGASELLRDVFGDAKMSCRLIVGVASLPLGVPVALELIFEVEEPS